MTAVSKNVYFDLLNDILIKYNNTVQGNIKMKPTDVSLKWNQSDSYAKYNEDSNVAKLKIQFRGNTWLVTWMVKKLLEVFMEKNCKKLEKVLKTKCDKLYIKWKGYGNSCNSWIDKKDLI